jgi:hypothetical protein
MGDLIRLVVDRPGVGLGPAARLALLSGTHDRLAGAVLRWKRYRRWTAALPATRCELCRARAA